VIPVNDDKIHNIEKKEEFGRFSIQLRGLIISWHFTFKNKNCEGLDVFLSGRYVVAVGWSQP
jgi:hypothetical protein